MRDGLGLGLGCSHSGSGRLGRADRACRAFGHSWRGSIQRGFFSNFLPLSEVFSSSTMA